MDDSIADAVIQAHLCIIRSSEYLALNSKGFEVFGKLKALSLIVGPKAGSIKFVGALCHAFVQEPTNGLAVSK